MRAPLLRFHSHSLAHFSFRHPAPSATHVDLCFLRHRHNVIVRRLVRVVDVNHNSTNSTTSSSSSINLLLPVLLLLLLLLLLVVRPLRRPRWLWWCSIGDVVGDGVVEQDGVLGHHAHRSV